MKYKLNFFFEWGSDFVFQPANPETCEKFGAGMLPSESLSLTPETIERIHTLSQWHEDSLNWDYPPDPSLWRQDECDRFNAAAKDLFDTIVRELVEDFEVVNKQADLFEDPDLDEYFQDQKNFKRRQHS